MASSLDDILTRAEKLTPIIYQEKIAQFTSGDGPHTSNTTVNGFGSEKEKYTSGSLANDLNSIFRASEHLWRKNTGTASMQKNFLFGEKGVVFGVTAPVLQDPVVQTKNSYEDELVIDAERVRLESERAFFNHILLTRPTPSIESAKMPTPNQRQVSSLRSGRANPNIESRRELIFGEKIKKYLRSNKKRELHVLLNEAVKESGTDGIMAGVWSEVTSVINQKIAAERDDSTTIALLLEKACNYLNKLFVDHMNSIVEKNREQAERGGVPGTRGLVGAFLKLGNDDPDAEDGAVGGLPVWEVTYHCFRAGDVSAAKDALAQLGDFPQSAVLVAALNHLAREGRLDIELKQKLKVEWRHNANTVKDRFKRALYAALLGMDSPLADTMENWIWFKLIALRIDPHLTPMLYAEVQKTISIDYGESYFMSAGNSDFHLFFTALWLSGQFERAIQLLYNCGHMADAVHVAILAKDYGYLRNAMETGAGMIVIDSAHPTKCSLNIARLLVAYTKEFELTDVARALDYWFLLKGVKTPSGGEAFEMAVSRAVYLTGREDDILGTLTADGRREPGMIDQYMENPSSVISRVAQDTELSGEFLPAVRLYMLANAPDKAVQLLCTELSDALRSNRPNIAALKSLATEFVSGVAGKRSRASELSTLCLLLDISTLFDLCKAENAERAYDVSQQLRIIPSDPESVPIIASEFHLVPQKVREVIPDLCLLMMKCMVEAIRSSDIVDRKFIKQVKAIVLYAVSVNYKFPHHINSQLLQLQASVS